MLVLLHVTSAEAVSFPVDGEAVVYESQGKLCFRVERYIYAHSVISFLTRSRDVDFTGLMTAYLGLKATGGFLTSWTVWVYVVVLLGLAAGCLGRHGTLVAAERSMTRWLQPSVGPTQAHDDVSLPSSVSELMAGASIPEQPAASSNAL